MFKVKRKDEKMLYIKAVARVLYDELEKAVTWFFEKGNNFLKGLFTKSFVGLLPEAPRKRLVSKFGWDEKETIRYSTVFNLIIPAFLFYVYFTLVRTQIEIDKVTALRVVSHIIFFFLLTISVALFFYRFRFADKGDPIVSTLYYIGEKIVNYFKKINRKAKLRTKALIIAEIDYCHHCDRITPGKFECQECYNPKFVNCKKCGEIVKAGKVHCSALNH